MNAKAYILMIKLIKYHYFSVKKVPYLELCHLESRWDVLAYYIAIYINLRFKTCLENERLGTEILILPTLSCIGVRQTIKLLTVFPIMNFQIFYCCDLEN